MEAVFVSNFFNHHQKPFSDTMAARCSYTFVETEKMDGERRAMGWGLDGLPDYVTDAETYRTQNGGMLKRITEADAVIIGSAPDKLV